jgi:hypothetical protein
MPCVNDATLLKRDGSAGLAASRWWTAVCHVSRFAAAMDAFGTGARLVEPSGRERSDPAIAII